ncbi:molybdopterin-guanine dinucleotide biosynthesis protein B [Macrococcus sp. EM39E]|uniref:molybdopterin-guanine dinucleotide biosynthesis protein B n=1 Tax=Macrococcus animalis TaxID=3395467 RepID=UPI0039BE6C84
MVSILQVVGYKKSGKTTTMNTLIKLLKSQGFHIAVIKHHGDKSGQEIDIPQSRDHITYVESGADESIVQGYQYLHKLIQKEDVNTLENLEYIIQHEVTTNPDIILIEGYKQAKYDKIVLFNNVDDEKGLSQLSNVQYMLDTSMDIKESNKKLETFINKWVDDTRETI